MRALFLMVAVGVMASWAHAQPWRVVKNGQVTFTSNVEDLTPEQRAKVLARWREEGVPKPPQPPEVTPVTDPDRFPKVGVDALRDQPARPAPKPAGETPAGETASGEAGSDAPDPNAAAALQVRELDTQLNAARTELDVARRKALEIPSGQAYAVRNQAAEKVRILESKLRTARARAGMEPER